MIPSRKGSQVAGATIPDRITSANPAHAATLPDYEAVILAGGQGSRMGGQDKGLVCWRGLPLVDHMLSCLGQQTHPAKRIMISANRNLAQYRQRAAVFEDGQSGFDGPLKGIQTALRHCDADFLLVVPCDSPRLPPDVAVTLLTQGAGQAAYACTADVDHPLVCILPRDCLTSLDQYLATGQRRVMTWLSGMGAKPVAFPDESRFVNFNSPSALD